jgi:hypothetical protein
MSGKNLSVKGSSLLQENLNAFTLVVGLTLKMTALRSFEKVISYQPTRRNIPENLNP